MSLFQGDYGDEMSDEVSCLRFYVSAFPFGRQRETT
jgi:hypothetical protein